MANTTVLKETWKEDKVKLINAISTMKKSMTDFKAQRKSEWKSFKIKFNGDLEKVEKSLLKLSTLHKK